MFESGLVVILTDHGKVTAMMQIVKRMPVIPAHNIPFKRTHPMRIKLLNYWNKPCKKTFRFKWK
ncbi:hypothetical protein IU46_018660 [Pantoea agglomerans]|nr:hypothetical protein IU46_018660 [Pantoea agglomerans]